jgi:hypothetical protein
MCRSRSALAVQGVGLGRHIVAQQRVVEDIAEIADAADAAELLLQLHDLLHLVVDRGDVVHHLLDGLDQIGRVDDRDALSLRSLRDECAGDEADGSDEPEMCAHGNAPELEGDHTRPRIAASL